MDNLKKTIMEEGTTKGGSSNCKDKKRGVILELDDDLNGKKWKRRKIN